MHAALREKAFGVNQASGQDTSLSLEVCQVQGV